MNQTDQPQFVQRKTEVLSTFHHPFSPPRSSQTQQCHFQRQKAKFNRGANNSKKIFVTFSRRFFKIGEKISKISKKSQKSEKSVKDPKNIEKNLKITKIFRKISLF